MSFVVIIAVFLLKSLGVFGSVVWEIVMGVLGGGVVVTPLAAWSSRPIRRRSCGHLPPCGILYNIT